ncbi:MOSC domain-containing protein [uncultured Nostoc sp.]|uniref:MOSC domain-containing protein n=1 Tax=uncultured Nostoc sp. TaxID=340711 RepID=UPI00262137DB|nr:MOSC domain-containing protein [uncultured Nostoc sp.]
MKLVSVNVGLAREVAWKRKTVSTGIFKEPVSEWVMLRSLNLDGDRQADLTVHGGADKAVYVYPFEHYDYWRGQLPDTGLPLGILWRKFHDHWAERTGSEHWGLLSYRNCKTDGDTASSTLLQTEDSVWTT